MAQKPMIYDFIPAQGEEVPILISVPHCGTEFPDRIRNDFNQQLIAVPDDTDWFVNKLYGFAPAMGMPMISAKVSRWVVDLNRDPQDKPLYSDGRIITSVCPVTTFLGEPLYTDRRTAVTHDEIQRRLTEYYVPYHSKIKAEVERLKNKFGKVMIWDCHSIRRHVPTVHPEPFPDLILGDADGTTAGAVLSKIALSALSESGLEVKHNYPFRGGYITRSFGQPRDQQHALQLEMTKVNYMDNAEISFDEVRAEKIAGTLKRIFKNLINELRRS